MGDTSRFCTNCNKMTRWHKNWGIGHSQCKKCGFISLWGVKCRDGEDAPPETRILERKLELKFMMSGPRVYV
jgi:Zn ribbon nucleic-acid-binding protein